MALKDPMSPPEIAVRRLEARDLERVVDLYRTCFPGAAGRPRAEVQRKLGQLFVDGPFCDARLPPLVACEPGGEVVGFRGRLRRGWRLADERLLGSTTTGMMVPKERRRSGIATALRLATRQFEAETGVLADLGYSDRATADGRAFSASSIDPRTVRMEQYGFDWSLSLRRLGLRAAAALGTLERHLPQGAARQWLGSALLAGARAIPPRQYADARELRSVPLSPAALQEAVEAAGQDRALRIDEPLDTWAWLLEYLADYPSRGRFSGQVFVAEGGRPLGFGLGYRNDAGGFELLGFAAPLDARETVLRQVLSEAAAAGALFASGTACARELRTLLSWGARASPGTRASVRTARTDVRQYFEQMNVLFTGLEGERWL